MGAKFVSVAPTLQLDFTTATLALFVTLAVILATIAIKR